MTKVTRIGVTFPPELLKELDEILAKTGYKSRSKAIQDAVTLFPTRNGSEMKRQIKHDCCLWSTTTKSKDYRVDLPRSSTIMLL